MVFTVRVLYNDSRGEWVVGPSDETVASRSFFATKKDAKRRARKMAKHYDGKLKIEKKNGTLQNTNDYTNNGSSNSGGGFGLPGF